MSDGRALDNGKSCEVPDLQLLALSGQNNVRSHVWLWGAKQTWP